MPRPLQRDRRVDHRGDRAVQHALPLGRDQPSGRRRRPRDARARGALQGRDDRSPRRRHGRIPDWWINVRKSNTEPLLRLNVEGDTARSDGERHATRPSRVIRGAKTLRSAREVPQRTRRRRGVAGRAAHAGRARGRTLARCRATTRRRSRARSRGCATGASCWRWSASSPAANRFCSTRCSARSSSKQRHGGKRIAGLLATDINPSTATITELSYDVDESATAIYASGREERVPLGRLARFVAVGEEGQAARRDRRGRVRRAGPGARRGRLRFPERAVSSSPTRRGSRRSIPAHRRATLSYLPGADAVLYLIDTQQPFTEGDASFLGDRPALHRVGLHRPDQDRSVAHVDPSGER